MITIISGTNRPGSNTRKIAGHLQSVYERLGEPPGFLDLAELPAGVFAPESYTQKPAGFAPFARAVVEADGLVVVTPEYNGGVPGVLKYFIDLLPFPESFERKPVCFVGLAAGIWGALRPVEQLQSVFGYRNAFIYPERVFLPRVNDLLDEDGMLKDAPSKERLHEQAAGFVSFVHRLRPLPSS